MKLLKGILLGRSGVGKTTLLDAMRGEASSGLQSRMAWRARVQLRLGADDDVELQLSDTAGAERFRAIDPWYYARCHVAVLVYDVTDAESFRDLDYWLRQLRRYRGATGYTTVVVGTKTDMLRPGLGGKPRAVSVDDVRAWMTRHDLREANYFESSATKPASVKQVFRDICWAVDTANASAHESQVYRLVESGGEVLQEALISSPTGQQASNAPDEEEDGLQGDNRPCQLG